MNDNLPASDSRYSRRRVWLRRIVEVMLFVALVSGIRLWQQRDIPGITPPLSGTQLDGSPYTLPAKPGQPVLVHFWATWCSICRIDQDSIAAIARDHPNTITVAMQSGSSEEVSRHLAKQGVRFPAMNDTDGRIADMWGVHAVPASFILGPDGQIRFVEVGYTTGLGLRLRLWLAGR